MRTRLTNLPRTDKRRRNKKSSALARRQWQIGRLEWLEQRVLLASDLALSEFVSPSTAVPGEMVNYQIQLTNNGASPVTGITLANTLPSDVRFISASTSEGTVSETGSPVSGVTVTIPSLGAGDSEFLQVKVTPTTSAASPVSDNTTASASGETTVNSSAPLTINAAGSQAVQDLVVTKTATATTGVLEGQEINFTITVHNTDTTNTAHNVVISDILPAGEDYLNTEHGSDGVFKLSGKQLTDTIGDVAPGATASATYDVLITKAGTLTDTATATTSSGITNASAGDNVKSLSITSSAAPNGANLAVTKVASPTSVAPGQEVTYTATVVNNGSVAAQNVELTDLLPQGMNYVSSTPAAGSSSIIIENGSVVDEIGTLAANGGTATLTIVAAPDASLAGQVVTNQACATTSTGDTDPTDNCGFADVTINQPGTGAANVSIAKSGPTTGTVGQQLTYTMTVVNHGASAASNVTVTDILPLGETVDSTSDSLGGTVTQNDNVLSETIASLAAGATDTITVVVTPSQAGTLTDTASLSVPAGNSNSQTTSSVTTVVSGGAAAPNVSIEKTGPATATVGDNFDYTITVTNNGTSAASNVTVSDTLPGQVTFVSASDTLGGTISQSGGTVTDVVSSLPVGTDTITIHVHAAAAGSATDTATVSVTGNTNGQTSSSVTTNISAVAAPNVSIEKTGPATATVGDNFDYTITVTNNGTSAASNVTVSDTLPGQVTFVSASDTLGGTISQSGGTVTDVISSLPVGTDTITIHVHAAAAGSATDTATVSVTGNTNGQTSSSVTTNISAAAAPNVSIAKTGPANATVGSDFNYTVTVTNNGTSAASNVTVSDTLPGQVAFVSASDSAGGTISQSGGVVTDVISSLPVGTDTITIHVHPTTAGTVMNTATVSVTGNVSNQTSASVTTVIAAASGVNVSIVKAGPANATAGTGFDYTLSVKNNATAAASNVSVSDTLPSGVILVSATDNQGGTISIVGNQFTDVIGSLGAGATDTIVLHALPTAAGTVTNTASVNVTGNTSGQTQSSVTTTVGAATGINVSVVKTGPATATVGTAFDYTISVVNSGTTTANNVTVSDTLPNGISLGTSTDSQGGTITANGGSFTDVIGSLPAGATDTITLHVTPTAAGTVTNTATVTVTSNTSNQTQSSVTTVVSPSTTTSNVSVTKTGPATSTVGALLTYTITVTNNGTATANNVVTNDTLPSGVTFVSASDNRGGNITESGGVVTDTLGSLAAGATDTITLNVTPTAAGTITNTASVQVTGNTSGQTQSSVTTTVSSGGQGAANVSVNKSGPSTGTLGQALTYTIVITNNGNATASNVAFSDNLPASLGSISATDSLGGTITVNGNSLTETIGALGAGASDTITVTATPSQAGTIVNTAVITVPSGNQGQGSSSVTTTVSQTGPITGHTCFVNGQPGDGTDQTFVRNLYRELLGRDPDSSGNQAWLNYLATGNPTQSGNGQQSDAGRRHQVVDFFLSSPEYRNHLVNCMYENFLGRQADQGGLQFFVGQLNQGVDEEEVLSEIIGSQEYYADAGGTSQGFVNAMYRDILGRQADAGGAAYWTGQANLGNVPRDQFVREFLMTNEAEHKLLNANYPGAPGATGAPGTPAGGSYGLANMTGGGWENLYFQGTFLNGQNEAHNDFFAKLQGNTPWDDVIEDMLETEHYYNASQGY